MGSRNDSASDKRFIAEVKKPSAPPLDKGCKGKYYFSVSGRGFLGWRELTSF